MRLLYIIDPCLITILHVRMHICRQAGDGDAEEFVRLTTIFAPTGLTAAQLTEILMNNMEFQEFGINNFTITRFGQLVIITFPAAA